MENKGKHNILKHNTFIITERQRRLLDRKVLSKIRIEEALMSILGEKF